MNKLYNLFQYLLFVFLLISAGLVIVIIIFNNNNLVVLSIASALIVVCLLFLLLFYYLALRIISKRSISVTSNLALNFENALNFAGIGIIVYDESGAISYVSEYINELSDKNLVGMRLTTWIPELVNLINNPAQKININYKNCFFQVRIHSVTRTLIFKDVSQYRSLLWRFTGESPVVGLLSIDNLTHTLNSVNDSKGIEISNAIKSAIADFAKKFNVFLLSYSETNYFLMMSQEDYLPIVQEKFALLEEIKAIAQKQFNVDISLTIGLAYGASKISQLNELALTALELGQERGGDQVVVRNSAYSNYTFFGKQQFQKRETSQVKVRTFSRRFSKAINEAENVIISGHKFADYDCIASAICFYHIVKAYKVPVKIALDFNHLDKNAINSLSKCIPDEFRKNAYVDISKYDTAINEKTLLIVADTHVPNRIEIDDALKRVGSVIVIDHHIRNPVQIENATDSYIDPSASSTSEIAVEILRYQESKINLPQWVSTLLLTGIMMDTNFFRMRTGKRTFAASSYLQEIGADFFVAQSFLKDSPAEKKLKFNILRNITQINDRVLFVKADSELRIERSVLAQIAQELIQIQGIVAGFAVAIDPTGTPCMSARSNGSVSVIDVATKLNGGGHFDAAAAQGDSETDYESFANKVQEVIKQGSW